MDGVTLLLAATAISGLYMAWNIGANDVANAMGTSVGSGALTLRSALIVAALFEFVGALFAGGTVTRTISAGIVETEVIGGDPLVMAVGMTACLIAASIWLHIATSKGWPVSTTHSIVGAVLGFGLYVGGGSGVRWGVLGSIVASWFLSPALGGLLGYAIFSLIKRRVLNAPDALAGLHRIGPPLAFVVLTVVAFAITYEGVEQLRLDQPARIALPIASAVGLVGALIVHVMLRSRRSLLGDGSPTDRAERLFLVLQVLTACAVAFAHGSNDVANAVGPMAAVFHAMSEGVAEQVAIPLNVLMIGAFGIVLGLGTYGFRVMATVGSEITALTPSRGFAAEAAAAIVIVLASKLGLPVSTTHTIVGAIVGVGLARSFGAVNLDVIRGVLASWLITVPFAALISAALVALVTAFL
ncbi:MAG TPA: anion permease [Polyangiaceae bacterium LLY-WYZ-15_(1-7)]|nr:phosphate permease [Myxococcales bacterium]MAT27984.1 phosphate permease [Sandaracinus sp.]HJK89437.1 anion permease [Polyangiaceae bacterium LLY-WYZ-15_(1-7)]HJL06130.1 anion permease [Polyangiaceae bacterium LLY-WYZ-15_(1-7)]HJL06944.1 anion permease [Polyangiaceae bacterium LLY-WYZ-15_(1-7)]